MVFLDFLDLKKNCYLTRIRTKSTSQLHTWSWIFDKIIPSTTNKWWILIKGKLALQVLKAERCSPLSGFLRAWFMPGYMGLTTYLLIFPLGASFFFNFWNHLFIFNLAALGLSCCMQDLAPCPGIELRPPALGVQSLSHWTTREVPPWSFLWAVWLHKRGVVHFWVNSQE